jgi:putative Mn2+ efflux pump MntP
MVVRRNNLTWETVNQMDIIEILLIALGLAMDCFAVSITSGIAIKHQRINNALKIGTFFGLFQAFMPVVGWFLGLGFIGFISGIDHWIAFGLLGLIGCKMIYESTKLEESERKMSSLSTYVLIVLSVATSIDALAIGLSFAFLGVLIAVPIVVIGIVSFLLSFFGFLVGKRFRHLFEKRIEVVGGVILIGIGIKILVEHLG